MHSLLSRLLQKRGIKNFQELTTEEQATFEQWQAVLSKEELTIGDIKQFCELQIGTIEAKWKDMALENVKKAELIPYHTVFKLILSALDAPKAVREQVERQIQSLINQ